MALHYKNSADVLGKEGLLSMSERRHWNPDGYMLTVVLLIAFPLIPGVVGFIAGDRDPKQTATLLLILMDLCLALVAWRRRNGASTLKERREVFGLFVFTFAVLAILVIIKMNIPGARDFSGGDVLEAILGLSFIGGGMKLIQIITMPSDPEKYIESKTAHRGADFESN
ncbi:hypothetical protein MTQ22_03690 [Corynebacterium bovis]|uniref:hypothetical protein n=1 Tax=Corynebacterium bovis TaxID=36808 RepID=UPI003139AA19